MVALKSRSMFRPVIDGKFTEQWFRRISRTCSIYFAAADEGFAPGFFRMMSSHYTGTTAGPNDFTQTLKGGSIAVTVLAKPNAKISSLSGITSDGVEIQIAAPARDGEANAELIRFLATDILKVKKSKLSVDRGSKSRSKLVVIAADAALSRDAVISIIQSHLKQK